jgi:hypothetical protein
MKENWNLKIDQRLFSPQTLRMLKEHFRCLRNSERFTNFRITFCGNDFQVPSLKTDAEIASSDSCDTATQSKSRGLINFRGMELAMVKVIMEIGCLFTFGSFLKMYTFLVYVFPQLRLYMP